MPQGGWFWVLKGGPVSLLGPPLGSSLLLIIATDPGHLREWKGSWALHKRA